MDCAICFEALEDTAGTARLGCTHVFHRGCIAQWCEHQHTCPLCRTPFAAGAVRDAGARTPGLDTGFLVARVRSLLGDFARATDTAEKAYKREVVMRLVSRHCLQDDERVTAALASHNIVLA
jgi:hypothetical protein